jgi:hypothetical protein
MVGSELPEHVLPWRAPTHYRIACGRTPGLQLSSLQFTASPGAAPTQRSLGSSYMGSTRDPVHRAVGLPPGG